MTEPSSIRYEGKKGSGATVVVDHAKASAEISEIGGTLTSWVPQGKGEVLFTSAKASFEVGKAIRGGVPICWPWFGPHPKNDDQPRHGFVRDAIWVLQDSSETERGVRLLWVPSDAVNLPEGVSVSYEISIGEQLEMRLTTLNQGSSPFRMSQALHSYFAVGDLTKARIRGLEDCHFEDALAGSIRKIQRGVLDLEDAIDAIFYTSGGELELEDPAGERRLRLIPEGCHSIVVWNPGKDGGREMSDLENDAYLRFVCVETANVRQNDQLIPVGQSHTLGVRVSVESCC